MLSLRLSVRTRRCHPHFLPHPFWWLMDVESAAEELMMCALQHPKSGASFSPPSSTATARPDEPLPLFKSSWTSTYHSPTTTFHKRFLFNCFLYLIFSFCRNYHHHADTVAKAKAPKPSFFTVEVAVFCDFVLHFFAWSLLLCLLLSVGSLSERRGTYAHLLLLPRRLDVSWCALFKGAVTHW